MPQQRTLPRQITRYVLQGDTAPVHAEQTAQAASQAMLAMDAAEWAEAIDLEAIMPPHNVVRDGTPLGTYDAYKYCADWDGNAFTQRLYAGCACYVINIPRDAWANPADIAQIASVTANVAADRWVGDGCQWQRR